MRFILMCLFVISLLGCHDNVQEKQAEMAVARAETPIEKKKTKIQLPAYIKEVGGDLSKYNLFYVFDNSCSFCITKFIEVVQQFQLYKGGNFDKTRYFFITINKDTSKIRYYLDKYNISVSRNQYLLPDKNNEFVKLNLGITGTNKVSYILTDSTYNTIILGDPFSDFNCRDTYDSLGILKRHSGE